MNEREHPSLAAVVIEVATPMFYGVISTCRPRN